MISPHSCWLLPQSHSSQASKLLSYLPWRSSPALRKIAPGPGSPLLRQAGRCDAGGPNLGNMETHGLQHADINCACVFFCVVSTLTHSLTHSLSLYLSLSPHLATPSARKAQIIWASWATRPHSKSFPFACGTDVAGAARLR